HVLTVDPRPQADHLRHRYRVARPQKVHPVHVEQISRCTGRVACDEIQRAAGGRRVVDVDREVRVQLPGTRAGYRRGAQQRTGRRVPAHLGDAAAGLRGGAQPDAVDVRQRRGPDAPPVTVLDKADVLAATGDVGALLDGDARRVVALAAW